MNSWNPYRLVTVLVAVVALVVALAITPAQAHHRPGHGGGPSGGGDECSLDFDVVFHDVGGCDGEPGDDRVCSDGLGTYSNGVQKVLAIGGDGARVDSNTSQKLEGAKGVRELCFDFMGVDPNKRPFVFDCKGFDLRIQHQDPDHFPLCEMEEGKTIYEGLRISFEVQGAIDNSMLLIYGVDRNVNNPSVGVCGEKVQVTRKPGNIWEFTGATACLTETIWASKSSIGPTVADDLMMPFTMTITAQ